ncbi:MAG TPA: hypothetical protein DIU09_03870 [Hyphomonadaceae bacterium]|nr:hypothetical protein [Hyphomonadaceae bacterium]
MFSSAQTRRKPLLPRRHINKKRIITTPNDEAIGFITLLHPTHENVPNNQMMICILWVYKNCAEAKRAANAAFLKSAYSIQGMTP